MDEWKPSIKSNSLDKWVNLSNLNGGPSMAFTRLVSQICPVHMPMRRENHITLSGKQFAYSQSNDVLDQ
jgi:hypothetical protein